jgi:hypothetical protein
MLAVCFGLVLTFYTGFLLDWSSLEGLALTFQHWVQIGTAGESGHEKEFSYWLQLIARYEWPAAIGLIASAFLLAPHTDRLARYLVISGLGTLVAYSIVPYKTPWCLIVLIWPFYFVFGMAVLRLREAVDRWTVNGAVALLLLLSVGASTRLNFRDFADENEPYVYVQTLSEIDRLFRPLRALVRLDRANHHIRGHVIGPDHHPLPWMLGDFTRVNFTDAEHLPQQLDADFLLVDDLLAGELEPQLRDTYFREPLRVRGNAAESSILYLRERTFRFFFPDRAAEFSPHEAVELKDPELHLDFPEKAEP